MSHPRAAGEGHPVWTNGPIGSSGCQTVKKTGKPTKPGSAGTVYGRHASESNTLTGCKEEDVKIQAARTAPGSRTGRGPVKGSRARDRMHLRENLSSSR